MSSLADMQLLDFGSRILFLTSVYLFVFELIAARKFSSVENTGCPISHTCHTSLYTKPCDMQYAFSNSSVTCCIELTTFTNSILPIVSVIVNFGATCYMVAMPPFLTDQIIGPTSDEQSAIVQWYYWTIIIGHALTEIIWQYFGYNEVIIGKILVVPLAVIIISDCLCQQWLDRTHKVTNPIKLIIQVLNYTRRHIYRRSACINEEQLPRMNSAKNKFGGPFTEVEVEDVKTVLCLLPMVVCLSLFVDGLISIHIILYYLNSRTLSRNYWVPFILIPFYQLVLRHIINSYSSRKLKCFGACLFVAILFYLIYIDLSSSTLYFVHVEWYWQVYYDFLFSIAKTIGNILLLELIITRSPDKMKGLVLGSMLACQGVVMIVSNWTVRLIAFIYYITYLMHD